MHLAHAALLLAASTIAGALNSVAGGGSFLTFPALLLTGMGAIPANATSTVALWPGSIASAAGYRRELRSERRALLLLGGPSLLGGGLGALLLVRTPPAVFWHVLPFLLLVATLVFTFGERLRRFAEAQRSSAGVWVAAALQLVISIYGGYFGGGMGLMMLAAFTLAGVGDIHRMNAVKSALAVLINGVAIATFVAARLVAWLPAGLMILGSVAGGYGGAAVARGLDPKKVRRFVVVYAWLLTAYFFWLSYR